MGIAQTKYAAEAPATNSATVPSRQLEYSSPLKNSAMLNEEMMKDPRSPTARRSPIVSSRANSLAHKERIYKRFSPTGPLDPRSPAPNRTPTSQTVSSTVLATPPPFRLNMSAQINTVDPRSPSMIRTPLSHTQETSAADPRSPSVFRTPLSLTQETHYEDPRSPSIFRTPLSHTQETPSASEDVAVIEQAISEGLARAVAEGQVTVDLKALQVDVVVVEESERGGIDTVASKSVTEVFDSPTKLPPLPSLALSLSVALAVSPMYSPSIVRRKGKELSPLKKSYSAPADENACVAPSPSKLHKGTQARTPLSPLSQNTRCVSSAALQPIKFRIDPGILG